MSIYDRLAERAHEAALVPEGTGYFSEPEKTLDPKLFTANDHIRPDIRTGVTSLLYGFWRSDYRNPESWSKVYLAGSGVSYQWSAARSPGDLDCLITVDWVSFRYHNDDYRFLGDDELQDLLNQQLHDDLWPETSNWRGYELTLYINKGSIASIHPYAAYDLTDNTWVVKPDPTAHPPVDPRWQHLADQDASIAQEIVGSYNRAYNEVEGTLNPGLRLNAEITLRTTAAKGAALFDNIHEGRKKAFSPTGQGYHDFNEFRYKSAKASGIMGALREMKVELQEAGLLDERDTYGVNLPDAHRTLVAAALERRFRR